MNTTMLTDEQIDATLESLDCLFWDVSEGATHDFARAIEQAVLQSPEVQRLKAIEAAAERVLSMPQEDGYIVLTVHLDALRAAMEKQP